MSLMLLRPHTSNAHLPWSAPRLYASSVHLPGAVCLWPHPVGCPTPTLVLVPQGSPTAVAGGSLVAVAAEATSPWAVAALPWEAWWHGKPRLLYR